MAVKITTAANYWISPNALTITLNALGEPNRIQASVASGAVIMVYMRGIKAADPSDPETALNGDGLEFDNGHNYRRWPLSISPTYFNTNEEKYIYVAIPRKESVGTDAVVVFPSQKLDIYGYSLKEEPVRNARGQMIDEDGYPTDDIDKAVKEEVPDEHVGTDDYWYVWLQGIVTETNGVSLRDWRAICESGYLDSDEAVSSLETEWYKWDPISGTVTFLKEIFMDAGSIFSNLKAKVAEIAELNVTNLLDAVRAKIDDIRSHNFEEGLTDGNGFRLTADNGEGSSELEVDFLKVRKKATFMELEIRKETYVGGNQNYSPAGSVVYRVEYLDVNDQPLGYATKKVPWLLKGFAFLGGPFAGAFHLASKRRIYVGMTDEEWPKCHHFRCYLISDDGTTATRNWWRYGDQAKCQSFNKAATVQSKHNNTYESGTVVEPDPATPMAERTYASQPIETSYWWRMVTNTGSKLLEDGYVYDFVDFPYEGWDVVIGGIRHHYSDIEKNSFRDPGSGMPVAGDTLVCIGNRIEEDRMNLINLSTTGDDNAPPSIRGYRGIHNFKMERSNQVFKISPEETLFRSKRFYLLNDDDEQFRVPLERGEWEMGQRYHWYDRVSWDGSIWLCVVLDDYVWQDANGNDYRELDVTDIEQGEGSFTYYAYDRQIPGLDWDEVEDGDLVYSGTDHYYATGKVGSTIVYKIKVYTYLEPSDDHNAVWLCEVSKGTEITHSEIHYAASLDGINHPDDESDDWKDTIEATGVLAGQYLWTRTTTYYRDKNDPDREPTRTYSVARWGIDGDGISEINSYYLARLSEATINASNDNFPMPPTSSSSAADRKKWNDAVADAKWFDTFSDCAAANGGVGQMQGWLVWEKTVITYDMAPNPDGTPVTKPDLINYKSSRIGQDGQIGEEEYYCLSEYDMFEKAFPTESAFPWPWEIGINWLVQMDPASENWRLANTDGPNQKICTEQSKAEAPWYQTTHYPNCPVWSPTMPAYDDSTPAKAKKKYLWNFEQRIDGQGTEYATKPICIGDHSRGIVGVLELYALSAGSGPQTTGRHIPDDVWKANGNSETDYQHPSQDPKDTLKTWSDEVYDRAPTETLPYQWNWTRTLYNQPKYPGGKIPASLGGGDEPTDPKTGKWYEDHYHVSAVRGTKGEDGAGVEYIYCRTADANPPQGYLNHAGNVSGYGHIEADETVTIGGKTYPRCRYDDDFTPDPTTVSGVTYTWTDNPRGITQELPYEWVCERKSESYMLDGKFAGGHIWSEFSAPKEWSKWGYNGQDGDGTEYVFIRTTKDIAPVLSSATEKDSHGRSVTDAEYLPMISNASACGAETNGKAGECTDDPKGTTRDWPYEWVAKRTMAAAATSGENQGRRVWKSYYESVGSPYKMSRWANYAENAMRLDIDNEMDMVQTDSNGNVEKGRTVTTKATVYDGAKVATDATINDSADTLAIGTKANGNPNKPTITRNADGTYTITWTFAVGDKINPTNTVDIDFLFLTVPYTARFTLVASMGQPVYQLAPMSSSINFKRTAKNELSPSSAALGLKILKIDGNDTKELTSPPTDYTIRYGTSSMPASKNAGTAWGTSDGTDGITWNSGVMVIASSVAVSDIYIALFYGDITVDRETIPILKDGENGDGIVSVTRTYQISASGTAPSGNDYPTDIESWVATSPSVTEAKPYLWAKEVTDYKYQADTTRYYCVGARGQNGIDAQDVEYVFARSKTSTPPSVANNNAHDGTSVDKDDYTPAVSGAYTMSNGNVVAQSYATDDPQGVTKNLPFEWVAKRTKGTADSTTGKRSWQGYPLGSMQLWATYTDSPWVADLDNEMDSVSCDDTNIVPVDQTVSTKVFLNYGATKKNCKITGVTRGSTPMTNGTASSKVKASWPTDAGLERTLTITYQTGASVSGKDDFAITMVADDDSTVTRVLHFTVNGINGDVYNLLTGESEIVAQYDGTNYKVGASTTVTMNCGYTKNVKGSITTVKNSSDGVVDGKYYIFFRKRKRSNKVWGTWNGSSEVFDGSGTPMYNRYKGGSTSLDVNTYDAFQFVLTAKGASQTGGYAVDDISPIDVETVYVVANGKNGETPTISIGDNKHWIINGVDTGIKAEGTDGTGVAIKGEVANKAAREALTNVSKGDCYIQTDNRHLYMWDGETWIDLGEFKGEPGKSSYVHIAYATSITFNGSTISAVTGFTVDNAGIEYDWWGFCTDNNETDPGRGASSTDVTAARKYKWNYMKGKDGDGVEYIYLLTKEGFTPTIDESGGASGHSDKTKDEFYPKVGNWSSYKTSIYNQSQYWSDDPPASVSETWPMLWWAKREQKDGTWKSFGSVRLHNRYSKDGPSSFTSHVFKRQNSQPDTPTGGSYSSPVPSGWSDGVPSGTAMVWMSTRIFSSDGKSPQQSAWTTPRQMTDTADFDVEFSSVASPNPPSGHPNTNTQWGNTADSTTIWMATSECHNGVWSDWKVAKIKGEKGDDGVNFTIECADTIKPGDTALDVKVKRSEGSTIETKNYKTASADWGVTLQRSITPSTSSATVDLTNSRVTLSGIVATTQLTLILQKNGQNVATKVIRAVADGGTGATGHVGRWYYYAGVYDGTPGHYKMEKTRSPFVKQSATSNNFWMLDFQSVEPEGHEKTATVGPTASGQTEWTSMLATFQYIITEAVFSNFAKLGSFIINDDWMISKHGLFYGSGTPHVVDDSFKYAGYTVDTAYTKFSPSHPNDKDPSMSYNFCPNFAVDARTGKTYQNDAYLKGQIVATSGQITGTMTVGTYGSGNNSIRLLPSDTNGAAVKGFAGTTQKFNLGFYNGGPRLTMGSGYYDEQTVWFIDDNGASAIFAIDSSGTPYVQLLRKVNGASKWIRLEISSGGVGKIESNCWPSRSEVSKNQVYVQTESDYDGTLRVRLRD